VTAPEVHPEVRDAADALVAALGDDLRALLWHGSYARGEATPESDHDMIVILKRIDDDALLRLREVFRDRANWSTLVLSQQELRRYPATGRLQFHFGIQRLHGHFDPPPWTRDSLLEDLRRLAADIRFECRYRLLHKQDANAGAGYPFAEFQRYRNLRMLQYAAKWAVLALKARELLEGRPYPVTQSELRERLADPDDLAVVELVERWPELRPRYEADIAPLALRLDAFARRLVAWLETEDTKHETRGGGTRVSSRVSRVLKRGRGS
jgi:hypothetical protein